LQRQDGQPLLVLDGRHQPRQLLLTLSVEPSAPRPIAEPQIEREVPDTDRDLDLADGPVPESARGQDEVYVLLDRPGIVLRFPGKSHVGLGAADRARRRQGRHLLLRGVLGELMLPEPRLLAIELGAPEVLGRHSSFSWAIAFRSADFIAVTDLL
jgi:hypothetical protein